jgi:hypothetical protein
MNDLENEINQELEIIYQQRSLKANNMDEIDQSDTPDITLNPELKTQNNYKNETSCKCLADTQKRNKFEKIIDESDGSYYFYQLDDETNTYLDPL